MRLNDTPDAVGCTAYCNWSFVQSLQRSATLCIRLNTLRHTATHYDTMQHTATHCNTLQYSAFAASHCNTLQHSATHCNTLHSPQHTATHCDTPQHRVSFKQLIAFGVAFNLNLHSQSHWSLVTGTRQKRPRELDLG